MVSFRFHLVSLVAVFLALGLGVLTGTTVLNRGIVSQLERQTEGLSEDLDTLREDLARVQGEGEVWSAFGEAAVAPLVAGRLSGRQVLIVTQDGTDEETLASVRGALEQAGAQVTALLSATPRMAIGTPGDREDLASAVGLEASADPEDIEEEAARLLAQRIAGGPEAGEFLELLLDGDFLVVQGARLEEEGLRNLGGPEQVVVAVAGGPASSRLRPEAFLVPLVSQLTAAGMPVAAAEPADAEDQEPPFVTALRGDGAVAPRIATQDNVDQVPGQVGLVFGLEDLLQGTPGHYGVKDGAAAPLPELG